jgi:hypothetical protein
MVERLQRFLYFLNFIFATLNQTFGALQRGHVLILVSTDEKEGRHGQPDQNANCHTPKQKQTGRDATLGFDDL